MFFEEGELVGDNTFELLAHVYVEVSHRIAVDGALGSLRSVTESCLWRRNTVGIADAKEDRAPHVRYSSARRIERDFKRHSGRNVIAEVLLAQPGSIEQSERAFDYVRAVHQPNLAGAGCDLDAYWWTAKKTGELVLRGGGSQPCASSCRHLPSGGKSVGKGALSDRGNDVCVVGGGHDRVSTTE